jgi:LAO/AO transport system kinase
MEKLSADPNAFIRPTPSSGSLGGVARKTRETITLCEAAGFDTILIETVGVGQSETAVHSMVDMFVLLVLATAGDELQGIKRGIMEMADLVIINKDDGENASYTKLAKASYHQALHMFPAKESGWTVPVISCSSLSGNGIDDTLKSTESYFNHVRVNGFLEAQRANQNGFWLKQAIYEELNQRFYSEPSTKKGLEQLTEDVKNGKVSPFAAARELLKNWGYKS